MSITMRILSPSLTLVLALSSSAEAQSTIVFDSSEQGQDGTSVWSGTTSLGVLDWFGNQEAATSRLHVDVAVGAEPTGSADLSTVFPFPSVLGWPSSASVTGVVYDPQAPGMVYASVIPAISGVELEAQPFVIDGNGAFAASCTARFPSTSADMIEVQLAVPPFTISQIPMAGIETDPFLLTGVLQPVAYGYEMTIDAAVPFDFTDPLSGLTGTLFSTLSAILGDQATWYCEGLPNSTGAPAETVSFGSTRLFLGQHQLLTTGLPLNEFGLYFYGPNQVNVPFGDGIGCVGGQLVRLEPVQSGALGLAMRTIDNATLPAAGQIVAGEQVNFQFWYRDPAAGGSGFNLSSATSVIFQP